MPGDEIFYLSVSELAKRIESKKALARRSDAGISRPQPKARDLDLTPTPA